MEEKKPTGYPSIDKPWLKYYLEEIAKVDLPNCTLFDLLLQNNRMRPNDIALVYFNNKITYGALFSQIHEAINGLYALGIRSGDVVSIISITTPEFVYAFYALNYLGAIVNMIDPRASAKTKATQIAATHSNLLIILDECTDDLDEVLKLVRVEKVVMTQVYQSMGFPIKQLYLLKKKTTRKPQMNQQIISWDSIMQQGSKKPDIHSDGYSPALIEYTGGTTGEPKGVLLSNLNVNSIAEQYRLVAKDQVRQQTWLTVSAPFIAYSLICGLHIPLVSGMICCIELYDPEAVAKTIVRKKYNHVAVTPIVWENIIKNPRFKKHDFSFLIAPTSGADYMSPKLEREINAFFESHNCTWKICQGYGMTEVGSAAAFSFSNSCYKPGSVGVPFPHTIISAFDVESGLEMPCGETGEICICGPGVMLGYFNNSEATSQVILSHKDGLKWMHTGDIGRIDEDGNLFITGRIKRMITRFDGFKVFPSAVEEKILAHPAVEKCSVVGKKDLRSDAGQLPVAFLVLKDGNLKQSDKIVEEIKGHCEKSLPEYARPVQFFVKDFLPMTAAGKIDYRTLEQDAQDETKL